MREETIDCRGLCAVRAGEMFVFHALTPAYKSELATTMKILKARDENLGAFCLEMDYTNLELRVINHIQEGVLWGR